MDTGMNKLLLGVVFSLLVVPCRAKVITVDDDGLANYRTIQEAINKSWDGDTVVVRPGTYSETVVFNGRAITLTSQDPNDAAIVQTTVISGTADYSVVFDFGEGADSVLTGFTITKRGISCVRASPTISKNVIRNCQSRGILGQNNAAPVIADNAIISCKAEAVYSCDGPITDNTISDNGAGVAYCKGPVTDNIISGNHNTNPGYGGGLSYCDGEIAGNVIRGNYAAFRGGGLHACGGNIHNNVIAGNRAGLSGGGLYNCTKAIRNNTIVGNVAGGDGGGLGACTSLVVNNVIVFNKANSGAGIHGLCSSSYNDFWSNTGGNFGGGATAGVGDIVVDPLFAIDGYWDDNGTADQGDDFWVHGDYHLKSQAGRWEPGDRRWVKDDVTSHCIDAGDPGSDWKGELWPHGKRINLGAYGGTAQASMSLIELGNIADLDYNDSVNCGDLGFLTEDWLLEDVLLSSDLNRDGVVDSADFVIFARNWRAGPPPPTPPIPDPMTWAVRPYATSPYSAAMVATTAISTDGSGIEYYFEDYFSREYNSGWISFAPGLEPRWEDVNLLPDTMYWYRVKARNKSNRLETGWAERFFALTMREDTMPPTPNPATWQMQPYASSATSVRMIATTASDDSGVEYQFECTSHSIYSSNWQDSPIYEVTSLAKDLYTFVARARDKSRNHNTTLHSIPVTVDLKPPTPDPMQWASAPRETYGGGGTFDYYATMTAANATDESAGVQYFFQCTTIGGLSSTWQSSTVYTVKVGRRDQGHRFHVKARDVHGNETGWSSELPAD